MSDIINLIINSGASVVIIAYFIYKDNKFNDNLVKTLTEIVTTLKDMQSDIERGNENEKGNE